MNHVYKDYGKEGTKIKRRHNEPNLSYKTEMWQHQPKRAYETNLTLQTKGEKGKQTNNRMPKCSSTKKPEPTYENIMKHFKERWIRWNQNEALQTKLDKVNQNYA